MSTTIRSGLSLGASAIVNLEMLLCPKLSA
jgi:hypothetical protein